MKYLILLALTSIYTHALAADAKATKAKKETNPAPVAEVKPAEGEEEVDLSKITEKYWAEGKETELGVVQNRKYTSANKFELAVFGGSISSDPFLKVNSLGGSFGYHLTSYTSVHAIYWKHLVKPSDALRTFERETNGDTVNTNKPKAYYGGEIRQNFLYGKASLFGGTIIYVDVFVLGGLGVTSTESGDYFTPTLGLGQKIYLNQRMSLNLDYRYMTYSERILSKNPATLGQPVGTRSNSTDVISLGVSFFLF